jgi:hypothetical protein
MHLGAPTLLGRLAKAEEERIDAPRCVYSPWPTGQGGGGANRCTSVHLLSLAEWPRLRRSE